MIDPMKATVVFDVEGGPLDGHYTLDESAMRDADRDFAASQVWGMYVLTNFGQVGKRVMGVSPATWTAMKQAKLPEDREKFKQFGGGAHKYEIVSRDGESPAIRLKAKYIGTN